MNVNYTVRFDGVPAKRAAQIDRMLREDTAGYVERIAIDSVTVEKQREKEKRKADAKP